jgi:hypothetical protein
MKLKEAQKLAEQAIYKYTSSSKWQEVKYLKWTTSEMQDVIAKALVENLALSGVSHRRELLIGFAESYQNCHLDGDINETVDWYLRVKDN